MTPARLAVLAGLLWLPTLGAAVVVRPVTWDEARGIVARLSDALPPDLAAIPDSDRPKAWPAWVARRTAEIGARLARGDEDSVVNLLLFGTSFTSEPRLTAAFLEDLDRQWKAGDRAGAERTLTRAYRRRAADLVTAASAGADERMRFARTVIERGGQRVDSAEGRARAQDHLLALVVRARGEAAELARALDAARAIPDSTAAFAERSRVFRTRGLAPDSSVLTQYAVDAALAEIAARSLLAPGRGARIAIVGPGLDFVDKQEGLDFYPPQSLQPFAVMDSLVRRGLARLGEVDVVALDVNPRVTRHLRDARRAADAGGTPYRLVLPRPGQGWLPEAVAYWTHAGETIGTAFAARPPTALGGLVARGVAVAPRALARLTTLDANIVYDRVGAPFEGRFDLVLATNVLIYYDTFEQTLALSGIASLLRPGGLLLTNTALLEIPEVPMRSGGYLTVRFSDKEGDGEHMVWYVRGERSPAGG